MRELCSRCNLEIPKHFPEVEGRLCPSCYKKYAGECQVCGDSPVEIVEFHRVYGLLVIGFSGKRILVACADCTRRFGLKNLLYTAFFGWAGITPFYKSFRGQRANLRSLYKHPALPLATRLPLTLVAFLVPVAAVVALLVALLLGAFSADGPADPFAPPPEKAVEARRLGDDELAAGHPERAAHHYREAVSLAPENPAFRLALGHALERQGRLEEAEAEYRRALDLAGDVPYRILRMSLAKLLLETDRPGEAADVLSIEAKGTVPDALTLEMHRLYQDALEAGGREAEALETYDGFLAGEGEKNPFALYLAARPRVKTEPAQAARLLEKALREDPQFFQAAYALGRLHQMRGDWEEAEGAYRRALGIRRSSRQARYSLGEVLSLAGAFDEAMEQFTRLQRDFPDSPWGFLGGGEVAVRRGDAESALSLLETALEKAGADPARFEAHLRRGLAMRLQGRKEEALASFGRAAESPVELQRAQAAAWAAETLARLGRAEEAKGRWAEAKERGAGSWPGPAGALFTGATGEDAYRRAFARDGPLAGYAPFGMYFLGLWLESEGREAEAGEAYSWASPSPFFRALRGG